MFPNAFEYFAPTTVEETIGLLKEYGYEARILAGGHSLLPIMKLRVAQPRVILDINQIAALQGWQEEEGQLRIGALVRHAEVEYAQALTESYPLLGKTARLIADPPIRNRGTVCGSLAHADPNSDWGAAMLALRADVEIIGEKGKRKVDIDDFFVDTFTTCLEEDELVSAVLIPAPAGKVGARYLKLERKAGDFAIVGVALNITLSEDGTVLDAGIGLCACGDIPLRAAKAEQALVGGRLTADRIEEASKLAQAAAQPATDLRGTAEYKKDLIRVFVKRGLQEIANDFQ